MELSVIEKSKNKVVFRIEGENHTLCNAIKEELYNDKNVKSAGYFIEHPAIGVPTMVVETKQGSDAVKAILDAVKRLEKLNKKFITVFKKEIK